MLNSHLPNSDQTLQKVLTRASCIIDDMPEVITRPKAPDVYMGGCPNPKPAN